MQTSNNRALPAAAVVFLMIVTAYFYLSAGDRFAGQSAFVFLSGITFGVLLQRSRFCFFCILRDLFEDGDGRPAAGLLTALVAGGAGYLILFGNWIPEPSGGYLPQDAHIGPVGWHLAAGGLLFGWGMALSGSCISAHLYRLGEGYSVAPIALAGTSVGFMLGFISWNRLYVWTISEAPVVWFPDLGGYAPWAVIQTGLLLAMILWLLLRYSRPGSAAAVSTQSAARSDASQPLPVSSGCEPTPAPAPAPTSASAPAGFTSFAASEENASDTAPSGFAGPVDTGCGDGAAPDFERSNYQSMDDPVRGYTFAHLWKLVFVSRWPTWVGGIGVGILSFLYYLRVEPLGVTAEIGRRSRDLGNHLEIIPTRLEGLDGFAGCSTATTPDLLTSNGIFILALVAGSLFTGVLSGRFQLSNLTVTKAIKGFFGGILLGFGAMISLGCTVGTTLSGISAFALSGWVFTAAMVMGVWTGIRLKWHH